MDQSQFSSMSPMQRLMTVFHGIGPAARFAYNDYSGLMNHLAYPDELRMLLKEYNPDLGLERTKGGPLDRAMNYGGGYQIGADTNVSEEDLDSLAKSYQMLQYLMGKNSSEEATRDYYENMLGVKAARSEKEKYPNVRKKAVEYARSK